MIRSYYIALHEVGHCVLGFDAEGAKAPQEAATWRWAIDQAIEPPTLGLKRMMFKKVWNYLLGDLEFLADRSNAERFPPPDDAFWTFLSSLDERSRLLYDAAKLTAHTRR